MSDTTVEFPPRVGDGVAAYVREVRAELTDLPVEDIDDLIGGMEADLTELAAESGGSLAGRLGSPSLYAAELRSAAGLPERVPGSDRRRRPVSDALTHARASFAMLTEQHPWLRSVTMFLVAIQPAWWVVRGYLAAWAIWSVFSGDSRGVRPHSFMAVVFALAAIVVSVQVGRGWLRKGALSRPLLVLANTALVVVARVASVSGGSSYYDGVVSYSPPPGVSLDGSQVDSIYAYDSAGNRITGVRLFDQEGRPLTTDRPLSETNPSAWAPPASIDSLIPSATSTPAPTTTPTTPARSGTATLSPALPTSGSPTTSSRPSPSVTRSGR